MVSVRHEMHADQNVMLLFPMLPCLRKNPSPILACTTCPTSTSAHTGQIIRGHVSKQAVHIVQPPWDVVQVRRGMELIPVRAKPDFCRPQALSQSPAGTFGHCLRQIQSHNEGRKAPGDLRMQAVGAARSHTNLERGYQTTTRCLHNAA